MLFTEPAFLFLFLPVLLAAYYLPPGRWRNVLLTGASLFFYAMGEWRFLGWLCGSIALNYFIAIGISRSQGTAWSRRLLSFGIISDLALLVVFKYSSFLVGNLNFWRSVLHLPLVSVPTLALPLGISFFTFHKISYKIDVYRGVAEARRNPLDLSLYILLFPQLIAGPIIRYHDIAKELAVRFITRSDFAVGIRRFVTGLGKKMLVANTAASCADPVFALPLNELTAPLAWLGLVCYTVQIYFDFSGYSDMAIGLGRMFGFHFLENFDYPYISGSITEFWRRWHISLSRWFRDYLYIPLGGSRGTTLQTYRNLLVVFLLCGLWHGASWSFAVWGAYHGCFLILERILQPSSTAEGTGVLRHVYALLVVMVGWVFFRADSLGYALGFIQALVGLGLGRGQFFFARMYLNPFLIVMLLAGIMGSMPIGPFVRQFWEKHRAPWARPNLVDTGSCLLRDAFIGAVFLLSALEIAAGTYNPFIYFRF
jgi:alginate O-acetyltransferase complex protein AlgI